MDDMSFQVVRTMGRPSRLIQKPPKYQNITVLGKSRNSTPPRNYLRVPCPDLEVVPMVCSKRQLQLTSAPTSQLAFGRRDQVAWGVVPAVIRASKNRQKHQPSTP